MAKTLYLLNDLDDEVYRRRIPTQLHRGESRHAVARAIFHGQRGELRQRYREGKEDQLGALGLVVNAVVLWNTRYLDAGVPGTPYRSPTFEFQGITPVSRLCLPEGSRARQGTGVNGIPKQSVTPGSLPRGVGSHLRDRPAAGARDVRRRARDQRRNDHPKF